MENYVVNENKSARVVTLKKIILVTSFETIHENIEMIVKNITMRMSEKGWKNSEERNAYTNDDFDRNRFADLNFKLISIIKSKLNHSFKKQKVTN